MVVRSTFSRRRLLGVGTAVAAGSAASSFGLPVVGADAAPDRLVEPETFGGTRSEALAPAAADEQVIFFTPAALVPNSTSTTVAASSIYDATIRGVRPGGASAVLSASVNVPLGSTITGIEFVIAGFPQAGSVRFNRYAAETANDARTVFVAAAAGTGITVYSSPTLDERFDGTQTFEAYYASADATSWCKGIRVRYVPPAPPVAPAPAFTGLVTITPARAYDSRMNMSPDAHGAMSTGATRTISVANSRDLVTGTAVAELVPARATAIAYTLTATNTTGAGYLTVNPGGTTVVTASTINWSTAADNIANTSVVQLGGSRQVTVIQGGGGSADFIIDIVGYYV
jgi:hypothetical protein